MPALLLPTIKKYPCAQSNVQRNILLFNAITLTRAPLASSSAGGD